MKSIQEYLIRLLERQYYDVCVEVSIEGKPHQLNDETPLGSANITGTRLERVQ